jgi:hypothetical protein
MWSFLIWPLTSLIGQSHEFSIVSYSEPRTKHYISCTKNRLKLTYSNVPTVERSGKGKKWEGREERGRVVHYWIFLRIAYDLWESGYLGVVRKVVTNFLMVFHCTYFEIIAQLARISQKFSLVENAGVKLINPTCQRWDTDNQWQDEWIFRSWVDIHLTCQYQASHWR